MDLVYIFNLFKGSNGYDLLLAVLLCLMGAYVVYGELKLRGFWKMKIFGFSVAFMFIAAWITHIITCLVQAKYLLLIAGALIAPVGVIHGIGIWFGVSW